VVEGEKAVEAGRVFFPEYAVITSSNGARSADKADWSPLKGRSVVVWPDNDDEGKRYARDVARLASEAGASQVTIVPVPSSFPPKWDVADALPEGRNLEGMRRLLIDAIAARRPFAHVDASRAVAYPFRLTPDAVEYCEEEDDGKPRWVFVCSRLEIIAGTRSAAGDDWGRLLRVTDADGKCHDWAMPMSMLAGDGQAYRERLLSI